MASVLQKGRTSQILRRYRRSLLLCLEHTHRSALENHVHRTTGPPSVNQSEGWYNTHNEKNCDEPARVLWNADTTGLRARFRQAVEAPWNPKLHRRIVRVPSGSHDDQVDAASGVSRVVARLRRPEGAAVAAIIKTTGWQQHSVRGFVAGVAHKKPKLTSTSRDGERIYRIVDAKQRKPKASVSTTDQRAP